MAEHSTPLEFESLTRRELEILSLIADGLSNEDIAVRLVITLGTVKWHIQQVYSKLNVGSRTQAVALARTAGLLDAKSVQAKTHLTRHNLPHQPTPFVGRTYELATIARELADPGCRLLTLVGLGGIGKSRLATKAAEQQVPSFAHGVRFVPLTSVRSPQLLASAIA